MSLRLHKQQTTWKEGLYRKDVKDTTHTKTLLAVLFTPAQHGKVLRSGSREMVKGVIPHG